MTGGSGGRTLIVFSRKQKLTDIGKVIKQQKAKLEIESYYLFSSDFNGCSWKPLDKL